MGGAATSCLVSTTPDALALPAAISGVTSTPGWVSTCTVLTLPGLASDLNRESSKDPRKAPAAMPFALPRKAASSSPIQYLPTATVLTLALVAWAVASLPRAIHASPVIASASPRPTRPTCLNGIPATRVKTEEPAAPLNSCSSTRSLTTAARPGA